MEAKIRKKPIEIGSNLPATQQKENKDIQIDLFCSGKEVNQELINEIERLIEEGKTVKVKNADSFTVSIFKTFSDVDLETFMYLINVCAFTRDDYPVYANRMEAYRKIGLHVRIKIRTVEIKIDIFKA